MPGYIYRVAQKSLYRKKIEYLHYGWNKRADFLPMIEVCSSFTSIKIYLEGSFIKYIDFLLTCEKGIFFVEINSDT